MEIILLALGLSRDLVLQVVPLVERITAEKRDPTPEELASLKAAQKAEEDAFNSDLSKP